MSRLATVLLFASGMTREEVTLFDFASLVHDVKERGFMVALRHFTQNLIVKTLWLLWKLFAPYVLLRQVLAVLILQVGHEAILPVITRAFMKITIGEGRSKETDALDQRIALLEKEMAEAEHYDEWREAARAVESLKSQRYQVVDEVVNTSRVKRMHLKTNLYKRLVEMEDADELQYRLRSELHRKHWGMGSADDVTTRVHPQYRAALHEYLDQVCAALALIARGGKKSLPPPVRDPLSDEDDTLSRAVAAAVEEEETLEKKITALRGRADFFSETLHSFGRTALLLSGGARLGLLHLGVVRALLDQKLLPRVISGSSAGSIVAVMLGAYRDDELQDRLFNPANVNLKFFALANDDTKQTSVRRNPFMSALLLLPPPLPFLVHGISQVLPFWFSTGTLLDVNVLAKAIRDATGDLTFKEAFERTGRIINITVSPSGDSDYPMLLNYLTAPRVLLWSASVASCAIPGVFSPVELMAKDMHGNIVPYYHETLRWADGSVESDLPMQRLSELFNINHFVVSQVNPHARFLAPMGRKSQGKSKHASSLGKMVQTVADAFEETTKVVVNFCRDQSRSSVKHLASAMLLLSPLFPLFSPLKLLGKSVVPILTQKYTGDITIMPPMTMKGMVTILSNPSPDEYVDVLRQGERVTWPQISRMRLHVAIEFLLEDCRNSCRRHLKRLESELLESTSVNSHSSPRMTGSKMGQYASPNKPEYFRTGRGPSIDIIGIPTASVLNLHELDFPHSSSTGSNGVTRTNNNVGRGRRNSSSITVDETPQHQQTRGPYFTNSMEAGKTVQGGLARNGSFFALSDKLKSRVQSFAADLSTMGRQAAADSLEQEQEEEGQEEEEEEGDAASTGSGI